MSTQQSRDPTSSPPPSKKLQEKAASEAAQEPNAAPPAQGTQQQAHPSAASTTTSSSANKPAAATTTTASAPPAAARKSAARAQRQAANSANSSSTSTRARRPSAQAASSVPTLAPAPPPPTQTQTQAHAQAQPLPPPPHQYTLPPIPYQHGAPPPPHPQARMNPPFSVNGSPYTHSHPPPGPYHPPGPHNGVAHAPPPPYGYHPMQHYPTHQYHPYPNYPPYATMGYSPPPPPPPQQHPSPPEPSAPSPAPSASATKRKRKGTSESAKGKNADRVSDAEESAADMHKKRTKTQRACDSCRTRKIRCDVLTDMEPPVCQHCKQYGFECTFFLPITETRFKKKRLEEESTAVNSGGSKDKTAEPEGAQPSPKPEVTRNVRIDDTSCRHVLLQPGRMNLTLTLPGPTGPTSMTHLLHSTATVPQRAYHLYDQRYHHVWEVSKTGDGLIQVLEPTNDDAPAIKQIDLRVERDVIEKLINSYFIDIAPLVPIITQAEFLALSDPSPPPILLYSICLVASCKRDVPQAVFESLRVAVNDVIKSDDVLSTANIVNVQSLLILCQCADVHSQHVPNALSALWVRLGTAIRMAQDLGLHRAEAVKQNIERRRRVWGACVISDRWTSLTYGHPFMIDVQDCDARLPSSGDPNDHYTDELLRLSLILGRVLKTIYSPSGLAHATDEQLYELLNDMESWQSNLPEDLKFHGPQSARSAGLLHLLFSSVSMIFWRVFMRISYSCPAHLKFGLTIDQWTNLVQMTADSIDWLDANEDLYDVWMLVAYAATSCALVQYHTWARRKDMNAQAKLRKLRDCVRRWEASLQPEHMSTRRKTAEIITLLYETTQGPPVQVDEPVALNPTGGVIRKVQATFKGLKYKQDLTRPGGGVFVAHGKAKEGDYTNMPEGTVIINHGVSDEESEGEDSAAEVSLNVHPTNDSARSSSTQSLPSGAGFGSLRSSHASAPATHGGDIDVHMRAAIDADIAARRLPSGRMMPSTIVTSGAGAARAAAAGGSPPGSATSMINYTPLSAQATGSYANVNPALNMAGSSDVQVLNVLDVPQQPSTLQQFAVADSGLLEGLPGSMFDWPQWEHFFSRFNTSGDPNAMAAYAQAQAQAQAQHEQQIDPSVAQQR